MLPHIQVITVRYDALQITLTMTRALRSVMRLRLLAISLLTAAILSPVSLHAQNQASGGRFWISGGAGGGWARVSCSVCSPERNLGPTAYFRVGVSARDGLLFGTEVNAWTRVRDDERQWTRAIGAVAYMYPRASGPLFVKGGVSYVGFATENDVSI